MKKRKWSLEEKLKILEGCKKEGNAVTIRKYELYPSSCYGWLKRYGTKRHQWNKGSVKRILLNKSRRKVRFELTIAKHHIKKTFPSGKVNWRGVSSRDKGTGQLIFFNLL